MRNSKKVSQVMDLFVPGFAKNLGKPRTLGSEKEFITIDRQTGQMRLLYEQFAKHRNNGLQPQVDNATQHVISLKGRKIEVTTDAGSVEVISPAFPGLHQLHCWYHDTLVPQLSAMTPPDLVNLPLGMQPITWSDKLAALKKWAKKGRYQAMHEATRGQVGHSCYSASDQTSVSVTPDELIPVANSLSLASPLFIAIFSNGSVSDSRSGEYKAYREMIWDLFGPDYKERVGIRRPWFDLEEYLEYLVGLRVLFYRKKPGEWVVPDKTYGQLMDELAPEEWPNVMLWHESAIWPVIRPRFKRGLVEFRSCCPQPRSEAIAPSAAVVGAITNYQSLEGLLDEKPWWFWRDLRLHACRHGIDSKFRNRQLAELAREFLLIVESGLKKRGQGEEIYLANTMERLFSKSPWTWADRAGEIWQEQGIRGLIDNYPL